MGLRTVRCVQKPLGKIWVGGFMPQIQIWILGRGPNFPSHICCLRGGGCLLSPPPLSDLSRVDPLDGSAGAHSGRLLACMRNVLSSSPPMLIVGSEEDEVGECSIFRTEFLPFPRQLCI